MESLELQQQISLLNANVLELTELMLSTVDPIQRSLMLVRVVEQSNKLFCLENGFD